MIKLKLQARYFLAYLFMSVLIIGAFSYIFYRYTSKILIERETRSVVLLNEGFLDQTDDVLRDLDTASINIVYSNLVREQLSDIINIENGSDDFRSLVDFFVALNGTDLMVDQINLYDFNGKILQVGIKSNISTVDPDTLEWFEGVRENSGRKTISQPYSTTALLTPGTSRKIPAWYISLYRTFNNKYRQQVGIIETIKKASSVFKNIISYRKKTDNPAQVYIYDDSGHLLYPYKPDELEQLDIPDYFNARDTQVASRSFHDDRSGVHEIMAYQTSSYSGWTYVTVMPERYILAPVRELLNLLLGVSLFMVLLCGLISYQLSRKMTQPIKLLQGIIRQTALDNLGQEKQPSLNTSFDEIEELNQEFSRMSTNLKTSMDDLITSKQQELKSRNLALQSQINPHFYYNTLASIIVLAEDNQSDQVVTICRNLTKMMRYITDGALPQVPLQDEIGYIRQYLYCMKVRYQSSLTYEIDIDERILREPVPKLVIQPLVENSLKYTTTCPPPWHLKIVSHVSEDSWQIDVIDSGPGFSPESIRLIDRRIKEASSRTEMPDIQINGMGMLNVYLRWKFFCQDEIIFRYGNTTEGHGIVSLGRKRKEEEHS